MFKKYLLLIITGNLLITLHAMQPTEPVASTSGNANHNLLIARQNGDVEGMKKAILEGANPNDYYAHPLMHAVVLRDISFIRFLINHGANPEFQGTNGSALLFTQIYLRGTPIQKEILELFGRFPGRVSAEKKIREQ